jgi:hypothetical protein
MALDHLTRRASPRTAATTYEPPPIPAERSPLIIRTVADIERLSISPKAAKRLPREGLVVAIPGLDEPARSAFQRQIKRYARACGCAAGGATFLLTSAAIMVYATSLALDHAWVALARTIVDGLIGVLILTVIAKLLGLYIARLRFRRSCARLIRLLSGASGCP